MKNNMISVCRVTIDELASRRYFYGLSAKESEQMNRAKNLIEDLKDWQELSKEDAQDVVERFKKLVKVNEELGI